MKLFETKWAKYIGGVLGGAVAGIILIVGATKVGYPAISQLVGLSVAQSSTLWNNVIDAAKGDAQSSGILGQSPYVFNGLTFDRVRGDITNGMDVDVTRMSGSITPADAYANPTTANQMWSLLGGLNGSTWDRLRTASATNNTAGTSLGALQVASLGTWNITDTDTAGTSSVSKAAGGGTVRHVATAISVCIAAGATAQPAITVNLRDGATGAGTVIRAWSLAGPVNTGQCISENGLNITGTGNTAMTIEFAAAAAAGVITTVNLSGYSTP